MTAVAPGTLRHRAIRAVKLAHCLCQEVGYLGLATGKSLGCPKPLEAL